MKTHRFLRAAGRTVLLLALPCALLPGCGDPQQRRSSVKFHAEGCRKSLEMLRRVLRLWKAEKLQEPHYDIPIAIDTLSRALSGLPARIEKKATTRVEERKAAAEKARALFEQLRPKLNSRGFEEAEVNAKLDELARLLDEVERE